MMRNEFKYRVVKTSGGSYMELGDMDACSGTQWPSPKCGLIFFAYFAVCFKTVICTDINTNYKIHCKLL